MSIPIKIPISSDAMVILVALPFSRGARFVTFGAYVPLIHACVATVRVGRGEEVLRGDHITLLVFLRV